jgi:hypothetical protein
LRRDGERDETIEEGGKSMIYATYGDSELYRYRTTLVHTHPLEGRKVPAHLLLSCIFEELDAVLASDNAAGRKNGQDCMSTGNHMMYSTEYACTHACVAS